ncbi:hypothetical protein [Nitrosospira briensis]|uniref:hypothetical protein n=1 Tax=Nitrosospira briensis TaxID=35799 RepID=UPI0015A5AD07|nr:hypothetical protein [Nitrosospira briensis]
MMPDLMRFLPNTITQRIAENIPFLNDVSCQSVQRSDADYRTDNKNGQRKPLFRHEQQRYLPEY